jgi:hypothetical protein
MVSQIQSLHQTIRALFDENSYETFLQGSYRNDTATKEINDVDIVILRKNTVSAIFSNERYDSVRSWEDIRAEILAVLSSNPTYRGRITSEEKCFRITVGYEVDVVPAVRVAAKWQDDPIAIYDTATGEISTSPRRHSANCELKNQLTGENFKPIVRMFKWWSRRNVEPVAAPSFFVESLLYNVHDQLFTGAYGSDFLTLAKIILENLPPNVAARRESVITPGEEKPLFSPADWSFEKYNVFYQRLLESYRVMMRGVAATSISEAVRVWKQLMGQEFPSTV